jgi:hypothetical protein
MTQPAPGARDLTGRTTIAAVFDDRADAQAAIDELRAAGFTADQIGAALRDRTDAGELVAEPGPDAVEGAVEGALGGGLLGGATGFLVGLVGALLIPGIGPIVAAGTLASALGVATGAAVAGAGLGAAAGGIAGALASLGVPEEEARYFETELRQGGMLVTVRTGGRMDEALNILERHHGDTGAQAWNAPETGLAGGPTA